MVKFMKEAKGGGGGGFRLFIAANNWACASLSSCDDFQLFAFNFLPVSTKVKDYTKSNKTQSHKTPNEIPVRTTKTQQIATKCHKNREEPQKTQNPRMHKEATKQQNQRTVTNRTINIDPTSMTCSQVLIKIPNIVGSVVDMQIGIHTNHNPQVLNS